MLLVSRDSPPIRCPPPTLFDESSMLCLGPDQVTCSASRSPTNIPKARPTASPILIETAASVDSSSGSITGTKQPQVLLHPSPIPSPSAPSLKTTTTTAPIVNSPATTTGMVEQSHPSPPSSFESLPLVCPDDSFTGVLPHKQCTEYYYCILGNPHPPSVPCPPGTLFDQSLMYCLNESQVLCSTDSHPTVTISSPTQGLITPTRAPSERPVYISTETPTVSTMVTLGNSSSQTIDTVSRTVIPSAVPTPRPTAIPTQSPLVQSVLESSTSPVVQAAVTLSDQSSMCMPCLNDYTGPKATADCSGYCWCFDGILQEAFLPCPTGFLFSEIDTQCLPEERVACETLATTLSPANQHSNIVNSSSNSSSSSSSSAPDETIMAQNVSQTSLPNFDFDEPYIVIEMKLNDYPGDIGWSLLSFDGSINVAKPPGIYGSFKPQANVFEAIVFPMLSMSSLPSLELTFIISSVSGDGLCCSHGKGYYKIYAGSPAEENVVISGGEFKYFEMTTLMVSDDGVIFALDEKLSTYETSPSSPPTSSHNFHNLGLMNIDFGSNGTGEAVQTTQSSESNQSTETSSNRTSPIQENNDISSYLMEKKKNESRKRSMPIVFPVMASVGVISFASGVVLLLIAYRRKGMNLVDEDLSIKWSSHSNGSSTRSWNASEADSCMQRNLNFVDVEHSFSTESLDDSHSNESSCSWNVQAADCAIRENLSVVNVNRTHPTNSCPFR